MKNLILTLSGILIMAGAFAQAPCTPDSVTYTKTGIYPSQLPDATANVAYNTTIQFKIPKDTTAFGFTGHIDSATITSVESKDSIFSYKCSNASCTYKGGANGCVVLSGTPTNKEIGTDSLKVNVLAYVTIPGPTHLQAPYSGKVAMKIDANTGVFFQPLNNNFVLEQNFPNPFSSQTEIRFNTRSSQQAVLKVRNELGQQVFIKNMITGQGLNVVRFQRNSLPSGVYFYSISAGSDLLTRRMVIKD